MLATDWAWLLRPGDPLPPLAVDRRPLGPPAGQWWLLALSPGTCNCDPIQTRVGNLAALTCVDRAQDRDGAVARALGVGDGRATLPCCVVTEPGGSVAGAWTGATLEAALEQAVQALRDWQGK